MSITELQNDVYEITPYKMKNDEIISNVVKPLPNAYNFFILLVGAPGSGKTNLWLNLINKRSKNTYYKQFDRVYIFSSSLSTISTKIKLPEEQMLNGISKLEETLENLKSEPELKVLIILDDVVTDIKEKDEYILKMIYNRRHIAGGISLIIITQVYNKIPLTLRKCCTDLILFKTANKRELDSIFTDFIACDRSNFDAIVRYAYQKRNDFLWIKHQDNEFYRNFNLLTFDNHLDTS